MCTAEDLAAGWVHHPAGLCVRLSVDGGEIREVAFRARPGEPFSSGALRRISFREVRALALRDSDTGGEVIADPGGYRKPDAFYRAIADVFTAELAGGNRAPARVIAERQGVPVATVHRWLREARARGVPLPTSARRRARSL
jgi:hypothetical protein